jgi:hypothetical protein
LLPAKNGDPFTFVKAPLLALMAKAETLSELPLLT